MNNGSEQVSGIENREFSNEDWDNAINMLEKYCDERVCKSCDRKKDCEKRLINPPAEAKE